MLLLLLLFGLLLQFCIFPRNIRNKWLPLLLKQYIICYIDMSWWRLKRPQRYLWRILFLLPSLVDCSYLGVILRSRVHIELTIFIATTAAFILFEALFDTLCNYRYIYLFWSV